MAVESGDSLKIEIEKVLKKDLDDINVSEQLNRQRHLVELNPILFPDDIHKTFQYQFDDAIKKDFVITNSISMQEILKGTKFIDENYKKPRQSDIFDNLKDLEKYIVNPISHSSLF